jgi:signal transduction histidine kinase
LLLPWNTRRIVFEYAGLNLSFPEQVRFRFRLEGYEQSWNAPVSTRNADYTNLDPGPYRFHVIASNADQVWDEVGAELPFYIEPALWQTWWFRTAGVLVVVLMIAILYTLRLRQITETVNVRFEARLAERARIARELHDTLLQSFHGLMLRFQAAQNLLPDKPEQAQKSLAVAIERASKAITEGRDAVQELRTSESGFPDLLATLQAMGQQFSSLNDGKNSPEFRVVLEGTPRQLRPGFQQDLYRIVHEAVTNAFRHANATHIEVELRYAARMLRLRIRDDGKGIDASILKARERQGHWGLTGMEERARASRTQLEIWSEFNRGTEIELTAPANVAYAAAGRSLWERFRKGSHSRP